MNLQTLLVACAVLALPASEASGGPPTYVLKWGSLGSGPGQFQEASGMGIDAVGNIYVADRGNHRIQKFSADGTFLDAWGIQGTAPGQLIRPSDVAIAPSGEIFVSEPGQGRVQVFDASFALARVLSPIVAQSLSIDPTGTFLFGTSWPGDLTKYQASDGTPLGQWHYTLENGFKVYGISVGASGIVYVGDTARDRACALFSQTGCWGGYGTIPGSFVTPGAASVDAAESVVYVADLHRVQKFTSAEQFVTQFGSEGGGNGQFSDVPDDIVLDQSGNVYVLDTSLARIQQFSDTATPVLPRTWGRLKLLYR